MSLNESMTMDNVSDNRHNLAVAISDNYSSWKSARRVAENRWRETTNYVYATSTRETANGVVGGQDGEGWSHSTHIPKITQIHDNLLANYRFALFPHNDWFQFIGVDRDSVNYEVRNAVEAYLKTKHRLCKFEDTILELLNDWVLYGNCFAEVTYETRITPKENGVENYNDYVGPVVNRISPYDIVFNPLAESFANTPKIVRSIKSMGDFLRSVEEDATSEYDPEVINLIKETRRESFLAKEGETDKAAQMTLDGFGTWTQYLKSGYIEILTFYGDIWDSQSGELMKNHKIEVVDRHWILSKEEIETPSGKPRIHHSPWRARPDNLWGMGPLDNLVGMQYQINHLENAKADALDQMIFPTRVIVGEMDESEVEPGRPGGSYRSLTGEGSVANLAPDTTILQADFMNASKMQLMEELAGSPREAMGIRTPGEKTAFEVSSLQNAASRNFQNKISHFESSFLEKIVNDELEVARIYLDASDTVQYRSPDVDAFEFVDITREDLDVRGKLVPIGARHFARQQQLLANATQLLQLAAQDQMVLSHFPSKKLARIYEELLGLEELDLFEEYGRMMEQQEMQQAMDLMQAEREVNMEDQGAQPLA